MSRLRKLFSCKTARQDLPKALPWAILLLGFCIRLLWYSKFWGSTLLGSELGVVSDISAGMVQADYMNRLGSLLPPTGWFYSTSFTIFSVFPFQIGLALFDSWHRARIVALAIFISLDIGAYLLFAKGLRLSGRGAVSVLCMVCTLGAVVNWFTFEGMMYFSPIYVTFFSAGLAFLALNAKSAHRFYFLSLAFCIAGLFFTAETSLRYLLNWTLPFTAAVAVFGLFKLSGIPQLPSVRTWKASFAGKACVLAFFHLLFCFVGFVINAKVFPIFFTFSSQSGSAKLHPFQTETFFSLIDWIPALLGYQAGASLFSLAGIQSLAGLLLSFLALFSLIRSFFVWKYCSDLAKMGLLVCWAVPFCVLLGIGLTEIEQAPRYMIPGIYFFFPAMHLVRDHDPLRKSQLRLVFPAALAFCFLLLDSWQLKDLLTKPRAPLPPVAAVANWLVENDYTQGYADLFEASSLVLTEVTDGRLVVRTVYNPHDMGFPGWLQEKRLVYEKPEGPVFLFYNVETQEEDVWTQPYAPLAIAGYEADGYAALVFANASDLLENTWAHG